MWHKNIKKNQDEKQKKIKNKYLKKKRKKTKVIRAA